MSGPVVLYINTSSSVCGACGFSCLPEEKSHVAPSGHSQLPGCGATYTHVDTYYMSPAVMSAAIRMRPDLIPVATPHDREPTHLTMKQD